MANKYLSNVPLDKVFWVCDGRILKNMAELAEALKTMSDDTYAYHCNSEKNDFVNWVRDVIGDTNLSDEINGVRKREIAFQRVKHRMDVLKGKVEEKKVKKKSKKPKKIKKAKHKSSKKKSKKSKTKKKPVKKTKKKKR